MKNSMKVNGRLYDVQKRDKDLWLSRGTSENGETIVLHNFHSDAVSGKITHHLNGSEYLTAWQIENNKIKFD